MYCQIFNVYANNIAGEVCPCRKRKTSTRIVELLAPQTHRLSLLVKRYGRGISSPAVALAPSATFALVFSTIAAINERVKEETAHQK